MFTSIDNILKLCSFPLHRDVMFYSFQAENLSVNTYSKFPDAVYFSMINLLDVWVMRGRDKSNI